MKTVHVSKTYTISGGGQAIDYWSAMVEDIILPLFNSFNNLTYIGKYTGGYQYVYKVNNMPNVCLRIGYGDYYGYPSIKLMTSNSNLLTEVDHFIGNQQDYSNHRIDMFDLGNNRVRIDFWMYYITDDDDNLKVFWTPNPSYGSKVISYPKVFTKTARNRDVIIDFASGNNSLNVFYLDDPTITNYYIAQNTLSYTSDSDVIKSNYLPISASNAVNGACTDMITGEMVQIFNSKFDAIYIVDQINNWGAFNKKLIRVNNKYYRQLQTNFWFEDPFGDESIIEYLDPVSNNVQGG